MEKEPFLPDDLQERLDLIEHKLKFVQQKPLVAVIADFAPVKTDPAILSAAVEKAGGVIVNEDQLYLAELILAYKKDAGMEQAMSGFSAVMQQNNWQQIPAVKNNRIYIIDRKKMDETGRIELIESLAEIINPKQFVFGYEGSLWLQFAV